MHHAVADVQEADVSQPAKHRLRRLNFEQLRPWRQPRALAPIPDPFDAFSDRVVNEFDRLLLPRRSESLVIALHARGLQSLADAGARFETGPPGTDG
jgi:hypothetical protein